MQSSGIKSRMGVAEWAMLIALSIVWGGSYFFVEVALTEWTPLLIVAVRIALAALFIWTVVLIAGYRVPTSIAAWTTFFGMGLLNNIIPFLLISYGQTQVTGGLAAILNASTPIFTVVVAGLFLRDEPMTPAKLLGSVVGFAGVAVLVGPGALAGFDASLVAQVAILGGSLSYAFAGVYGRRLKALNIDPLAAAAGQLLVSSVIMIVLALSFESPAQVLDTGWKVWASVGSMAVLSTGLAYLLYFRLLATAGATNVLLVTLLIPVTAVLLGTAFLGERLAALHLIGMLIIALGLSIIDGRAWSRFSKAE